MNYETPTLDVIESATQLIQAFYGPNSDYGAHVFSQMPLAPPCLEAED